MKNAELFPVVIEEFKVATNKTTGEEFHQLILTQEGLVQRADGSLRMGTKKCSITSTWNAEKCQKHVGRELQGFNIAKVSCEPYLFVIDGEEKELNHTWVLIPA